MKNALLILVALTSAIAFASIDGIKWVDGRELPIEGRWTYGDMAKYYCRLPDTMTTNVNANVRAMRVHTTGMQLRFRTDSKVIYVKYRASSNNYNGSGNIAGVAKSGWDAYRYDEAKGKWRFVTTSHNSSGVPDEEFMRVRKMNWTPGEACLINLPLYDGVEALFVGVELGAKIEALGPRKSGITKPVVFYGTSITHGASASRPGLAFVNQVGRDLDVPVYNLGFSGSGMMEFELARHIAKIDASCYVLDCLWNMLDNYNDRKCGDGSVLNPDIWCGVPRNYEPFIRELRRLRPDVPIVMAEQCDVYCGAPNVKDRFIRKLYERLKAEGWQKLYYLPKTDMYAADNEGSIDGIHPNDLGMKTMAIAFGKAVAEALGIKR